MAGVMKYTRLGNSGLKVSRISKFLFNTQYQYSPWVHVLWDRHMGKMGFERGGVPPAAQGCLGCGNPDMGYR